MEADVEKVMLDLSSQGVEIEDLGGTVPCIPISAKEKVNIKLLENTISKLAEQRLNLMENHNMKAQCIIIESNIDQKSGQTTATVLVKKGKLKLNDIFVSGLNDGRIKFMKDDNGRIIQEAYPG